MAKCFERGRLIKKTVDEFRKLAPVGQSTFSWLGMHIDQMPCRRLRYAAVVSEDRVRYYDRFRKASAVFDSQTHGSNECAGNCVVEVVSEEGLMVSLRPGKA